MIRIVSSSALHSYDTCCDSCLFPFSNSWLVLSDDNLIQDSNIQVVGNQISINFANVLYPFLKTSPGPKIDIP